MSTIGSFNTASGPTGLLGVLVSNSEKTKTQLDQYTEQASTGLVSQTYGGLGTTATVSLNLRPQLAATAVYTQNITLASTVVTTSSQVMTQLQQIASTFLSGTLNFSAQTPGAIDTIATQAQAALAQVQTLMNTQLGQSYIFSGQDSGNPPMLPSGSSTTPGTFDYYLQQIKVATTSNLALDTLNGTKTTAAATLAAANANSPFSSYLSAPAASPMPAAIQPQMTGIGFGVSVKVGIVAGQPATMTGANTTGSYVRDLIRSLATLSVLTGSDLTTSANSAASFNALIADTRTSLTNQGTAINQEVAGLGSSQQVLTANQTTLTDTQSSLTQQISSVENVDAAATATALTQAQTQLQISYKLIASMQSLSLVQYLPA